MRARSKPSLIAGVGLGTMMLVSGYIIKEGSDLKGHTLALITSGLVVAGTLPRAVKTQKIVPAAVALVGLVSAFYQGQKVREWR